MTTKTWSQRSAIQEYERYQIIDVFQKCFRFFEKMDKYLSIFFFSRIVLAIF